MVNKKKLKRLCKKLKKKKWVQVVIVIVFFLLIGTTLILKLIEPKNDYIYYYKGKEYEGRLCGKVKVNGIDYCLNGDRWMPTDNYRKKGVQK